MFSTFSPDGKRVLSATSDLTRQGVIWDADSGAELLAIKNGGLANPNQGVDFSPDGSMIAISGGRGAAVYDSVTGAVINNLLGHRERVPGAMFIEGGSRVLTGGNDNTLRIWDVHSQLRPQVFGDAAHRIDNAHFSPDGSIVTTEFADGADCDYDLFNRTSDPPDHFPGSQWSSIHGAHARPEARRDRAARRHPSRPEPRDRNGAGHLRHTRDHRSIGSSSRPWTTVSSPIVMAARATCGICQSGRHIAVLAGGSIPNPPGDDGRTLETRLGSASPRALCVQS